VLAYPVAVSVTRQFLPLAESDANVLEFYERHPEMYLTDAEREREDHDGNTYLDSGGSRASEEPEDEKLTRYCWWWDSMMELLRLRGTTKREAWTREAGVQYRCHATVKNIAITPDCTTGPLAVWVSWMGRRKRPLRDIKRPFQYPQPEWLGVLGRFETQPLATRIHFAQLLHWAKWHRRRPLLQYVPWHPAQPSCVYRDDGLHGLARDEVYRYVRGWGYDKLWIGHDQKTGEPIYRSVGHPRIEYTVGKRRHWQWHGLASLKWFLMTHALPYTRRDLIGHISRKLLYGTPFRGSRLRFERKDIFRLFGMLQSDFERLVKAWRHQPIARNTSAEVEAHRKSIVEVEALTL
jgi:hypothetical protein